MKLSERTVSKLVYMEDRPLHLTIKATIDSINKTRKKLDILSKHTISIDCSAPFVKYRYINNILRSVNYNDNNKLSKKSSQRLCHALNNYFHFNFINYKKGKYKL